MPEKRTTIAGRVSELEGSYKAIMADLGEIKTTLRLANGNGKKPKRLEIIGGSIVLLVGLSELGILSSLKAVVFTFFAGGAG